MSDSGIVLITDPNKIWAHFGKNKDNVIRDITSIKYWIKSNNYFPEIPDDIMIQYFLTICNFSIERAKQCLDMYYAVRTVTPELFTNTSPTSIGMESTYEQMTCCPLPDLTKNLERIIIFKMNDVELDMFDVTKATALTYVNTFEVKMWEDLCLGEKIVVDFKNMKIGQAAALGPKVFRRIEFILEKVWNLHLKEIHCINVSTYAEKVVQICKAVFKNTLSEKIFTHKSIEDLHKFIPKEILPKEYGGSQKSLSELNDGWLKKLRQYKDRFAALENMDIFNANRPEFGTNNLAEYYGNYMKIDVE
ncbi:alpha-tocopherol transfer protein-like isoform X1 [Diabrotica virgifera virgifera]|uniref:Alpha-tocopherol transfer protein-like isoform X1 n=1 Tax=Diabrotica virgifera virgifera TaxID=50390 RepID=A0A6P7GQR4_DIAVI|nr:alpha-tocopherol transfer protein-like isoform X1 [Diabrotica virgifera virgifera]